jgi:Uncharacterised protein family (UPF0175)
VGYREQTLSLYQVSQMLGLSRVETEDFLGQHQVPLAAIEEAGLDREGAVLGAGSLFQALKDGVVIFVTSDPEP